MAITLRYEPYDEVASKIINLMQTENGIKEIFENKISRVNTSVVAFLIEKDGETIGFITLVNENIRNILFLDMGIIEKYRGKGYGKQAINELLETCSDFEEYIIGETRNTNGLACAMVNHNAALVHTRNNEFNYYIFPAERAAEFTNSDIYERFKSHCGNVPTKQKVLSRN